jgi:hypothetical protein
MGKINAVLNAQNTYYQDKSYKKKMHKDIKMYNIFKDTPENWKDLQVKVSQIFGDLGYNCEVEKDLETVRGKVNVDVYAENIIDSPSSIIIAECKNWSTNIPKSVVHSFRTIINDFGANYGIIISKNGFQKGAYEAANNSNIQLFNWDEFQDHFKVQWLETVIKNVDKIGRPLWYFTDYMGDFYNKELEKLPKQKQERFFKLRRKYSEFAFYSIKDMYLNHFTGDIEWLDKSIDERKVKIPVTVNSYSDYFYFVREYCIAGLNEFDELFGKKVRRH